MRVKLGSDCKVTTYRGNAMNIPILITRDGEGLPLPHRANALDGGIDVYAAETLLLWPWQRTKVPLGFIPRFDGTVVERDGTKFVKTVEVVNKGSGPLGVIFQAVVFDAGYMHPLNDPKGIQLIAYNVFPWPRLIRRGRKIAQLVVREVTLDDLEVSSFEDLAHIPQPDGRGPGRLGSSERR